MLHRPIDQRRRRLGELIKQRLQRAQRLVPPEPLRLRVRLVAHALPLLSIAEGGDSGEKRLLVVRYGAAQQPQIASRGRNENRETVREVLRVLRREAVEAQLVVTRCDEADLVL